MHSNLMQRDVSLKSIGFKRPVDRVRSTFNCVSGYEKKYGSGSMVKRNERQTAFLRLKQDIIGDVQLHRAHL